MNWTDEGALYSQIGLFLREDLGRGDVSSQALIARNTRARGRFVAEEGMIVAGLEAAEEVFLTLDSQLQLEAFVSDGEEVQAGKLIARTVGFADVLLAGQQVAVNLIGHLSGVATLTHQFVSAVNGTGTQIVDSREATPGLRMLERYAVGLGGGGVGRFGLDDGVVITSNHSVISGGIVSAVQSAKEKVGHLFKIAVQVANESEVSQALEESADSLIFDNLSVEDSVQLIARARALSDTISLECSGRFVTPQSARAFAEAGADRLSISTLNRRAAVVSFKMAAF